MISPRPSRQTVGIASCVASQADVGSQNRTLGGVQANGLLVLGVL